MAFRPAPTRLWMYFSVILSDSCPGSAGSPSTSHPDGPSWRRRRLGHDQRLFRIPEEHLISSCPAGAKRRNPRGLRLFLFNRLFRFWGAIAFSIVDRRASQGSARDDSTLVSLCPLLPLFHCSGAASVPTPRAGVPAPGTSGADLGMVAPLSSTFFCRYWM